MSMRDKIADMVKNYDWNAGADQFEVADAIIAALPDMIKQLVWKAQQNNRGLYCKLTEISGGEYEREYIILPSNSGSVLFFRSGHGTIVLDYFILVTDAIAAANAHYVSAIMGAFE